MLIDPLVFVFERLKQRIGNQIRFDFPVYFFCDVIFSQPIYPLFVMDCGEVSWGATTLAIRAMSQP